jgi:tetratricopeptide (TPR) repeat protein
MLGRVKWSTYCGDQPSDPSQAIALLERALKLDPTLDDPHYILWSMLRSKGRREDADAHLRTLLDRGQMPEPLVDFGYNLLAGLEPNAILLTNGDNDTYPEIALQAARGFRTDVVVVNVSLLNLQWYRRQLAAGPNPVPVPLLADGDTDARGDDALKGLLTQMEDAGSKRPLYAAVTVSCDAHPIPKTLSLEGVVYRIHSTAPPNEVDAAAMSQNLESRYRLESLTSVTTNWDDWSSLRLLSLNYASAFARMAIARAKAGDIARGRESMVRALEINDFHRGGVEGARWMISSWSNWDPNSPELARWKKKLNL